MLDEHWLNSSSLIRKLRSPNTPNILNAHLFGGDPELSCISTGSSGYNPVPSPDGRRKRTQRN